MSDIITKCTRHGIVNREPTPESITYIGIYRPGQMRYCPYCGQQTTIEWPEKHESCFHSVMNRKGFLDAPKEGDSDYLPPWEE